MAVLCWPCGGMIVMLALWWYDSYVGHVVVGHNGLRIAYNITSMVLSELMCSSLPIKS